MRFKMLPQFQGDIPKWIRGITAALSGADIGVDPGVITLARAGRVPEGWATITDATLPTIDPAFVWVVKE